ncbi:MAG TPA: hypothetical protein VFD46_02325, partial [Chryseolinea sp.]|nr:hypothetical protein [Chryseolinea sp.]
TFLLTAYFMVSFYNFGTLVIENDVNYSTWLCIPLHAFPSYHMELEKRLFVVFMIPLIVQGTLAFVLVITRTSRHQTLMILTALCIVYILAESLLVQVPIHAKLNTSPSMDLLEELISTHRLYRLPAEIILFFLTGILLFRHLIHVPDKTN